MKRRNVSTAAFLAFSFVMVGGGAGASHVTNTQRHAHTVTCTRALSGRGRLTKDQVVACTSSSFHVSRCPPGSKVIFVTTAKTVDAIAAGHRPVPLGKRPGLAALGRACGNATAPVTTTRSPRTTTTTGAPPVVLVPPATTPPLPTTTPNAPAVPASCTPINNEGGCYEPGESCPDSAHGLTGRAGDGEVITCEDNNGWTWEPT
jgi:hypothetical protein